MAELGDNVTVRSTRAGRRRELDLLNQRQTPVATSDSESGEHIVQPGESVVPPARATALSSSDNGVAWAQPQEQGDASAQESGKRAADTSLLVEVSPAIEQVSVSSGSAEPTRGFVLTEADGALQGRNRKRSRVLTDPSLGARCSAIFEDFAETDTGGVQEYEEVSTHSADRSGRGTHSGTPPTVAVAGLAPPNSGVKGGLETSTWSPMHAVGNQNAPAQQLGQYVLPQTDFVLAANTRDQREVIPALPQHRPEREAERPVESSGTHRGHDYRVHTL